MVIRSFIVVLFWLFSISTKSNAQVFMQLEIVHEIKAIKFYSGDRLRYKIYNEPKEWHTKRIDKIIFDENVLVMNNGYLHLKEISHITMQNQAAAAAGNTLIGFGLGWFLFGGIAHFATKDFTFGWNQAAIGGVSIGSGLFFSKIASKRKFTIGKNASLRLIDISFPDVPIH